MNERLEHLLKRAKFNLTDEEKLLYKNDLEKFKKQLLILDGFDLSEVKPLRQPFEKVEDFLREDIAEEKESNKILENASKTKDGYIFLEKKVTK